MREFKFKRILISDCDLQSLNPRMKEVLSRAFGNGIVVMRRQTWQWLKEDLKLIAPKNVYPNTRFVVINERDGRDVVYDTFYDGRIGVTHSEYNLMMPEIQERAFGPYWAQDGDAQEVILIEGSSHLTCYQHTFEDYKYSKAQVEMIYSVTSQGWIGLNGDVVCPIPEDFRHFQRHTKGNVLAMGYKTWASIPNKSKFILGNNESEIRKIAVLVNREVENSTEVFANWGLTEEAMKHVGLIYETNPEELVFTIGLIWKNEPLFDTRKLMICGGAGIYEKYAGIAEVIHETLVLTRKEGDVKLPASVKDGFCFFQGDPTFYTSKNGEVYRFNTYRRSIRKFN